MDRHPCLCGCGEPAQYAERHVKKSLRPDVKLTQWEERDLGFATPCHYWVGALNTGPRDGRYGRVFFAGRYRPAHRVIWERANGPLEAGLQLHHLCAITQCVNVDHLAPLNHRAHIRADRAKLDADRVRYIRAAKKPLAVIARELGVSKSLVSQVRARRLWDDVD